MNHEGGVEDPVIATGLEFSCKAVSSVLSVISGSHQATTMDLHVVIMMVNVRLLARRQRLLSGLFWYDQGDIQVNPSSIFPDAGN